MDDENSRSGQPELPVPSQPAPRTELPRRHESHGRTPVAGPLILIGIGLLFLAYNLGMVPASTIAEAWRLWPLVLVLVGLEIVLGRTNWAASIGLALTAVTILAFLGMMAFFLPWTTRAFVGERSLHFTTAEASSVEHVQEELGEARAAVIDLTHGAGRVYVHELPPGSESLIEADLSHDEYSKIERSVGRQGDRVSVRLRNRVDGELIRFGERSREDWSVGLSQRIPLEMAVNGGASDLNLELTDLRVTRLRVEAGASAVRVALPASAGHTDAFIKAGAAGVEVRVPEGVGARIKVSGGLSGIDVDESRFPKAGEYYESRDYASAENRVDLTVETGISGVNIR